MARKFVYAGQEYPDPDPAMSVEDVRKTLADFMGDLNNATYTETKQDGDTIVEFTRKMGVKGRT